MDPEDEQYSDDNPEQNSTEEEESDPDDEEQQSNERDEIQLQLAEIEAGIKLKKQILAADIHRASWQNDIGIVQELLKKDPSCVGKKDDTEYGEQFTPLHYAAYQGHLELVQLLVDQGADVNAQTEAGATPLFFAAQQGHFEAVKFLLNQDADISLSEKEHGLTAVDVCRDNTLIFETLKTSSTGGLPPKLAPPHFGRIKATAFEVIFEPVPPQKRVLPVKQYKFKVFLVADEESEDKLVEIIVAPPEPNRVVMKGLTPGSKYKCQVAGVNSFGVGPSSDFSDIVQT